LARLLLPELPPERGLEDGFDRPVVGLRLAPVGRRAADLPPLAEAVRFGAALTGRRAELLAAGFTGRFANGFFAATFLAGLRAGAGGRAVRALGFAAVVRPAVFATGRARFAAGAAAFLGRAAAGREA